MGTSGTKKQVCHHQNGHLQQVSSLGYIWRTDAVHSPSTRLQGFCNSSTFFTLQLDVQHDKVWNVQDALELLVVREMVQGFTNTKTRQEVDATRRITLEQLPAVLVLHLKWFVYDKNGGCQKLSKKVDFDVNLDIRKDLLSPNVRSKYQQDQRHYKLFAVLSHHGSRAVGGHYTTDSYHPGINGWIRHDDNVIKVVSVQQVLTVSPPKVPYLLYYQRSDLV